jgi:hypothetical protein
MTDEEIYYVILRVADVAWEIASNGGASAGVCLAIEDLTDDPAIRTELITQIKAALGKLSARRT